MTLAQTPEPPYYAVIFSSLRTPGDDDGYRAMADVMDTLARQQPGYLGHDHGGTSDGVNITVSYWSSLEAIAAWRRNVDHLAAQRAGREKWYAAFRLRVAKVERAIAFER